MNRIERERTVGLGVAAFFIAAAGFVGCEMGKRRDVESSLLNRTPIVMEAKDFEFSPTATLVALEESLAILTATSTATPIEVVKGIEIAGSSFALQGIPDRVDTDTATSTATPIEVVKGIEIAGSSFALQGIPDRVDIKNVDTAKGIFKNTIPGTEHVLAEPGSLLVGADFPQQTINQSGGSIERFNPGNQYVLQTDGPSYVNVAEGAFMMASGATMNVEVGKVNIQLNGETGRNWFLMIKGRFADGKQDSDLNLTAKITKYVPGHVLVSRHPVGAFISEGQFKQMAVTSHKEGSNCGKEGCSKCHFKIEMSPLPYLNFLHG